MRLVERGYFNDLVGSEELCLVKRERKMKKGNVLGG